MEKDSEKGKYLRIKDKGGQRVLMPFGGLEACCGCD